MRAAGKLKIKVNFAVFSFRVRRRVGRLAIQAGGKRGNLPGIGGNVQNVQITADAGEHNAVVYGRAVMRGKAVRAAKHAQNRADIAGVAVRVPAAHGGDFNGAGKIAVAVAQRQRAYAGVGNNVAYAGVTIVAEIAAQHLVAIAEAVRMRAVKIHHGAHHAGIFAIGGNLSQRGGENRLDIRRFKRGGDGGAHKPRAPKPFAVVGNAGGRLTEIRRARGLVGQREPPCVDENLAADLLRDGRAVLRDRAGARRGNAVFQV